MGRDIRYLPEVPGISQTNFWSHFPVGRRPRRRPPCTSCRPGCSGRSRGGWRRWRAPCWPLFITVFPGKSEGPERDSGKRVVDLVCRVRSRGRHKIQRLLSFFSFSLSFHQGRAVPSAKAAWNYFRVAVFPSSFMKIDALSRTMHAILFCLKYKALKK